MSPTLAVNDFSHHPTHANTSKSCDSRLAILPSPSPVFDLQYIYPIYIPDVSTKTVFSLPFHRRQAIHRHNSMGFKVSGFMPQALEGREALILRATLQS